MEFPESWIQYDFTATKSNMVSHANLIPINIFGMHLAEDFWLNKVSRMKVSHTVFD